MGLDPSKQHAVHYLALSTAAAVVYHHIAGSSSAIKDSEHLIGTLNRVAHAISNVAPIYALDSASGTQRQLHPTELIGAAFERGATVLKARSGTEYSGLTVLRGDMHAAIAVLRATGIRFD